MAHPSVFEEHVLELSGRIERAVPGSETWRTSLIRLAQLFDAELVARGIGPHTLRIRLAGRMVRLPSPRPEA